MRSKVSEFECLVWSSAHVTSKKLLSTVVHGIRCHGEQTTPLARGHYAFLPRWDIGFNFVVCLGTVCSTPLEPFPNLLQSGSRGSRLHNYFPHLRVNDPCFHKSLASKQEEVDNQLRPRFLDLVADLKIPMLQGVSALRLAPNLLPTATIRAATVWSANE